MTRPSASPRQHGDRRLFAVQLGLCLVMLVLRILDLLLFTDPATGFVETGWFGLRILLPAAVAVLAYLTARRAAPRPLALLGACPPLGGALLGAGVAMAAACPLELLAGGSMAWISAATALLSAVWCLVYGARAFRPLADPIARLPGAIWALPGVAFVFWCGIYRFAVAPASVVRLGYTLRVLSAVAALLFLVVLFRVFFTPGLPVGRSLYATGCNAFLFCTCHELPQAVFGQLYGRVTLAELAASLAFGLLGIAGLACAWYASGEGAPLPTDTKPARTTT